MFVKGVGGGVFFSTAVKFNDTLTDLSDEDKNGMVAFVGGYSMASHIRSGIFVFE